MHIIRSHDYRRMPWKNGGGETAEIAVFPPGADTARFDWRISMATVASDGPFSIFPGVDRTLTVLSGGPMILRMDDAMPCRLDRDAGPITFSGEIPVRATIEGDPVIDFNVMTRRANFTHEVHPLTIGTRQSLSHHDHAALLFCTAGRITVGDEHAASDCAVLDRHDVAMFEASDRMVTVSAAPDATALWVVINTV